MIVCICHRISDRDIAARVAGGCASFDALQDDTRVATACGCCLESASEVFAEHHQRACTGHCASCHAEDRAAALA